MNSISGLLRGIITGGKADSPGYTGKSITFLKPLLHVLAIAVLCLIVYANTFYSPFAFDDQLYVLDNPIIRDLGYFLEPSKARDHRWYLSFKYRYISYLTFAINYKLHGLQVTGYRVFNITVHFLNAVLVYFFVMLILKTPFMRPSALRGRAGPIAFFSAAIFVVHPVQTEAVTYIFQRHASLAALFYLLSTVTFIRWRLGGRGWLYACSLVAAVLAMKSKEIAFTLPLMLGLIEFMFFEGPVRKRIVLLVPFLLTMLIVPLTLVGVDRPAGEVVGALASTALQHTDLSDDMRAKYLFTEFRVVLTYIRLLFFPVGQNLDYDYPSYGAFL